LKRDLEKKIVLIGGSFAATRDEHSTRAGKRYGVEIMAQAIESDLQGVNIPPANTSLVKTLEVLAAITLIFLQYRFEKRKMTLSLIAIILLSLLCSLAATNFTTLSLWAKFTPMLLAVLIQQLQDQVKSYRKLLTEKMEEQAGGLREDWGRSFVRIVDKETPAIQSSGVEDKS
jgi:CHASE2 domain-containing sensor protein